MQLRPGEKEQSHTERMGEFVSFSPLTVWGQNQFGRKLGGGEFNSVFIAAGVCTCSRYYQHASRTSNNTILLLMTTTKPIAVNIIHGRAVRRQLRWQRRNEVETGQHCRGCWQKVDLMRAESEIRSSLAFWTRSVIGLSFMRWSRSGRICW